MPQEMLPKGSTLSCADLVMFSAFVQWVKQGAVKTGNQEDKIRLGFVALILNLACNLYELDPEKHCKQKENADKTEGTPEGSSDNSSQISCVPSSKLLNTPTRNRENNSLKKESLPAKSNPMATVIPVDIMAELDKMPNLSSESTPTKRNVDESDDCIEIIETPRVTPLKVTEVKGKEKLVFTVDSLKVVDAKDKQSNSDVIKKIKDAYNKDLDISVIETKTSKEESKNGEETSKSSTDNGKISITKVEDVEKSKTPGQAPEVVELNDVEEDDEAMKKKRERDLEEEKKKADALRIKAQLKKEEEIRNAVSESLGRLIQVVIKLMSKEDYTKFSRKVSKNLNNLDPKITDVTSLKKLIDTRRENIQAEEKNVFVHIKAVFDELKKYKKTGSSDNDLPKDAVKGEVASSSAPQVFRWMDGNDNPAEGDSTAAVVIENADDDEQASKQRETRPETNGQNKGDTTENDEGININQENEEVMIVDVPLDEDEKLDKDLVHSNMSIKEKAEKARRELEEAVDDTMEYLITKTEEATEKQNKGESAKRKRESSEEVEVPTKKKVALTMVTSSKPGDLKAKDDTKPPIKKKAVLTTLNSEAPEKSATSKTVEPEKEKSPPPPVMEGNNSKGNKEKPKKKVSEKHIEKLEAALKKCSAKIKEYEEKEVDWDNEVEEESNYLMTCKLKRRCMQIYSKIAEAKAISDSLDRRRDKRLKCVESR